MYVTDGQKVAYVGQGERLGQFGVVVASGNTASHVKWADGSYTEEAHTDLSPASNTTSVDTFAGGLLSFSSRAVVASKGVGGLLDALNNEGHLGAFDSIAEEALSLTASRIRQDASIREALADLDDEDGEALVSLAAVALLHDAFGQGRR